MVCHGKVFVSTKFPFSGRCLKPSNRTRTSSGSNCHQPGHSRVSETLIRNNETIVYKNIYIFLRKIRG